MQEVKITPSWALGTQPWLSWQTCQFAAFCAEKISTPWKNAANAINWGVWRWLQLSRSIFNFCIGFYWVCLGFIDFSPSKYQVLMDSFLFLGRVLGYFLFLPFWIIFDFSPYYYQVLQFFGGFYWAQPFFNEFWAIFNKKN